jgi:hypothetical protein
VGGAIPILTDISKEEFDRSDPIFRVIVHDPVATWRFASLKLPAASQALTMSWYSSTIEPVIEINPSTSAIWVGVDLRVVCLSPVGSVLFSMGLSTYLLNIIHFPTCIAILCELEIIAVDHNYSLWARYGLRDILDAGSVEMKDNKFSIRYINGEQDVLGGLWF